MRGKKAKQLRHIAKTLVNDSQNQSSFEGSPDYLKHKNTGQIIVNPNSFRGEYKELKKSFHET
jgi:hypothetical protein